MWQRRGTWHKDDRLGGKAGLGWCDIQVVNSKSPTTSCNCWSAEGLNIRRYTVRLVLLMYLIDFSHCSGKFKSSTLYRVLQQQQCHPLGHVMKCKSCRIDDSLRFGTTTFDMTMKELKTLHRVIWQSLVDRRPRSQPTRTMDLICFGEGS